MFCSVKEFASTVKVDEKLAVSAEIISLVALFVLHHRCVFVVQVRASLLDEHNFNRGHLHVENVFELSVSGSGTFSC